MSRVLYRAEGPVTLVGAGPATPDELAAALALAPEAVAADGGGDVGLPGGKDFTAVIGDMDSLLGMAPLRARGVMLHPLADQDSIDLEKCLYSVEAPLFIGVGFLGGRLDHTLAAMNALARYPGKRVVLLGERELTLLCPPRFELDLDAGTRVSLFPVAPVRGLASEGLRWPIEGLAFAPDGRIGTSNAALGGRVRIGLDGAGMLMILPQRELAQVVARLGGA